MANETNTGWVRLYRSTLGWEWFDDPLTLQLWVVCLLKANYLPTRWRGVEIERRGFRYLRRWFVRRNRTDDTTD